MAIRRRLGFIIWLAVLLATILTINIPLISNESYQLEIAPSESVNLQGSIYHVSERIVSLYIIAPKLNLFFDQFLHVFQKEDGEVFYYYQGSSRYKGGQRSEVIQLWLGGEDSVDKNFRIYIVRNTVPYYEKDSNGIYRTDNLPPNLMAEFSILRTR